MSRTSRPKGYKLTVSSLLWVRISPRLRFLRRQKFKLYRGYEGKLTLLKSGSGCRPELAFTPFHHSTPRAPNPAIPLLTGKGGE